MVECYRRGSSLSHGNTESLQQSHGQANLCSLQERHHQKHNELTTSANSQELQKQGFFQEHPFCNQSETGTGAAMAAPRCAHRYQKG